MGRRWWCSGIEGGLVVVVQWWCGVSGGGGVVVVQCWRCAVLAVCSVQAWETHPPPAETTLMRRRRICPAGRPSAPSSSTAPLCHSIQPCRKTMRRGFQFFQSVALTARFTAVPAIRTPSTPRSAAISVGRVAAVRVEVWQGRGGRRRCRLDLHEGGEMK